MATLRDRIEGATERLVDGAVQEQRKNTVDISAVHSLRFDDGMGSGFPADLGHEIPVSRRVGRRRRRSGSHVVAGGSGPGGAGARPRALGRPVPRGAGRLQVPAGRPGHRRRRHRAQRHPVQLLRHGRDPRRHVGHLREFEGSGAHHAAGRRHRPRLLDPAPAGRAGEGRRRRRLGAAVLHGRVGRHVPHHHERGLAPRRHDGDAALRPSRHRGLHRRQARSAAAAHVQPLGAGHRRLHGGGARTTPTGSSCSAARSSAR